MKRKILKLLKTWDGCQKTMETANDILDLVVKEGMLPPKSYQRDLGCECGCKGWCPKGNDWDYEHIPIGDMQTNRKY